MKGITPFFERVHAPYSKLPRPHDIDLSDGLSDTFGKCETEAAAANLVRFYQARGCWQPFTILELIDFYRKNLQLDDEGINRMFSGLAGAWEDNGGLSHLHESPDYFVLGADGCYYPTEEFIERLLKHHTKSFAAV